MNELDKIAADELVIMTKTLRRLFLIEKCDPACHCCYTKIDNFQHFRLAEVNGNDEMLCEKCTPENLIEMRRMEEIKKKRDRREYVKQKIAAGGHGFTRIHKQ